MTEFAPDHKQVILAITGASGAIYGIRALQMLSDLKVKTHLIISHTARKTIETETACTVSELEKLAGACYSVDDLSAPIASGSFPAYGMLVIPCSIKTLSGIANSYCDNLITRAADVCLKEGRPVLLAVREAPLHAGHIRLMALADQAGAIIYPPIPAFYGKPLSIEDLISHTVGRMLYRIGIENYHFPLWDGVS